MKYIKDYFKDIRIGDEVTDIILDKEGIIEDTEYYTEYPLKVVFDDGYYKFYTIDGRENKKDKTQRLFYKGYEPKIEIPEPPKRKFELQYDRKDSYYLFEEDAIFKIGKTFEIEEEIDFEDYKEIGWIRKTQENLKKALKQQIRVMRLHALAEQLDGLKEWKKGEENFYIYKGMGNNKWMFNYDVVCYFPETVYMTKECAERICEMLNNGEFSLEIEDE